MIIEIIEYALLGVAVLIVLRLQLKVFCSTKSNVKIFSSIFPVKDDSLEIIKNEEDGSVDGIDSRYNNPILNTIIISTNNYLKNNNGSVADFHIIKDIVDRNCDALEQEIDSKVPMPLYYGLMGTMAGIIIGVSSLIVSGGIKALLQSDGSTTSSATGITSLLTGVAIAMIASIVGIIFTTYGSKMMTSARAEVEKNKNLFLSWLQANLLPEISSDAALALSKLAANLKGFNDSFSKNNTQLNETLEIVKEATESQVSIIEKIDRLNITKIASVNLDVYDKLKDCTDQLAAFSQYVEFLNSFIENSSVIVDKITDVEKRTRMIEEMAHFFMEERSKIEQINALYKQIYTNVNQTLASSSEEFVNTLKITFSTLKQEIATISDDFSHQLKEHRSSLERLISENRKDTLDILESQKDDFNFAMNGKLSEFDTVNNNLAEVTNRINNLSELNKLISDLKHEVSQHNNKLDVLVDAISQMLHSAPVSNMRKDDAVETTSNRSDIVIIASCGFMCITCIGVLISLFVL